MHLMSKADLFLHRRRWHLEMRQGLEGDQLLDEMKSQVTENMKKRRIPPNGISEVAWARRDQWVIKDNHDDWRSYEEQVRRLKPDKPIAEAAYAKELARLAKENKIEDKKRKFMSDYSDGCTGGCSQ